MKADAFDRVLWTHVVRLSEHKVSEQCEPYESEFDWRLHSSWLGGDASFSLDAMCVCGKFLSVPIGFAVINEIMRAAINDMAAQIEGAS